MQNLFTNAAHGAGESSGWTPQEGPSAVRTFCVFESHVERDSVDFEARDPHPVSTELQQGELDDPGLLSESTIGHDSRRTDSVKTQAPDGVPPVPFFAQRIA